MKYILCFSYEKYFKRKCTFYESFNQSSLEVSFVHSPIQINLEELKVDPTERKSIYEYHINDVRFIMHFDSDHFIQLMMFHILS